MATATKGGKAPVAGQPGFDPFKSGSDPLDVVQDETERQVQPVAQKARRLRGGDSVGKARAASAVEFLEWLVASGMNPGRLVHARAWLVDNKDATAEQCFRYLEDAESLGDPPTSQGTIERAGKWLWGEGWKPESAAVQGTSEREAELRKQVAGLQAEIASKNAELVSVRAQLAYSEEQGKRLGSENDYLKKRGGPADVGPGHNVMDTAGAPV